MQPPQDVEFLPLTAFARAAAIASTSLMVPFAAYAHSPVATAPLATDLSASSIEYQPAEYQSVPATTLAQTLPLRPQPVLAVQPAFSYSKVARSEQAAADPNLLITRADDGSWQLAARVVAKISASTNPATRTSTSAATRTTPVSAPSRSGQAVLAQIIQNTALSSAACAAPECQPLRSATLGQNASLSGEQGDSAIARAQIMMADFPDGSLPKAILSIVVAAGAIATATAIAKQQTKALQSNSAENYLPRQNTVQPTVSLTGASHNTSQNASSTTKQNLQQNAQRFTPVSAPKRTLVELENDWLSDLWDITGRSTLEKSVDSTGTDQPDAFSEDHHLLETSLSEVAVSAVSKAAPFETLTLELMANELAEWVEQVTTHDSSGLAAGTAAGNAAGSTDPKPLRLPIEEVDRFAEQALLWILNEANPKAETEPDLEAVTPDADKAWQAA